LNRRFIQYLSQDQDSYKVAFFQDEYRYWPARAELLKQIKVDCVYTLFEPAWFEATYGKWADVKTLYHTLPGYVSEHLLAKAGEYDQQVQNRDIDVGYRARKLSYALGIGGQEKTMIGKQFLEAVRDQELSVDIKFGEEDRIYGDEWYRFIGRCKAMLGVEAGSSIVDIDQIVQPASQEIIARDPNISFDELSSRLLAEHEDNIFYRTISPRHFEAAALRTCQILFEGSYSGILEPMVHYIPLKKDFSNIDLVLEKLRDKQLRQKIVDKAYEDMIASGKYSYERFIQLFDSRLIEAGLKPGLDNGEIISVEEMLQKGHRFRHAKAKLFSVVMDILRKLPGIDIIKQLLAKSRLR
jgi:hypothetical protein